MVLMLAYSVLPKPSQTVTGADAQTLLLNDLAQQGIAADEIQVFNFTRSGEVWTADVLVTKGPHSKCPTVEKRSYSDVLSFKYRPEQLVKDCSPRSPIALREEAVIDSGALPAAAGADYACAFSAAELANYDAQKARVYCPLIDEAPLLNFARGLPSNAWVVQWDKGGSAGFIALDSFGNAIKNS